MSTGEQQEPQQQPQQLSEEAIEYARQVRRPCSLSPRRVASLTTLGFTCSSLTLQGGEMSGSWRNR